MQEKTIFLPYNSKCVKSVCVFGALLLMIFHAPPNPQAVAVGAPVPGPVVPPEVGKQKILINIIG